MSSETAASVGLGVASGVGLGVGFGVGAGVGFGVCTGVGLGFAVRTGVIVTCACSCWTGFSELREPPRPNTFDATITTSTQNHHFL